MKSAILKLRAQHWTSVSKILKPNAKKLSTQSLAINSKKSNDDPSLWVKSPYPDIEPITDVTVQEMIWSKLGQGKDRPSKTAIECGITGRKYTFGEVYKYSKAFGAALKHAGYGQGDILGIVLPNIPEYGIIVLGAWEAGMTVSPINPAYTSYEIQRQLFNSDVKCAVTNSLFLQTVEEAKKSIPDFKHLITVEPDPASNSCNIDGLHDFFQMIKTDTRGVEFMSGKHINTEEFLASLPYSSGTTGPPKGVMLTHYNIANVTNQFIQPDICASNEYDGSSEQERQLGLLPFFHSYGFAGILLLGLFQGSHTYCLPKFDPTTYLEGFRKHKPTLAHLVTPLISHMVNCADFGPNEFQHIHTIFASAAPIGPLIINRLLEKAGKYIFFQEGYGMTELSPCSHVNNRSVGNTKIGSCGRPIPNTWTKLIDVESKETLGRNMKGELLIRGPQVMKGYYKNEEATRSTIDEDGWLHTGDIAYYDDDGFCYIVDRLKELIKVKGFQVSPSELEDILREHPKVYDVAVIGIPDEKHGEVPRAYIVRNKSLNENDVHEYLEPKISSFKKLKGGIEFLESIPKAPSGKILRRELVLRYNKENGIN